MITKYHPNFNCQSLNHLDTKQCTSNIYYLCIIFNTYYLLLNYANQQSGAGVLSVRRYLPPCYTPHQHNPSTVSLSLTCLWCSRSWTLRCVCPHRSTAMFPPRTFDLKQVYNNNRVVKHFIFDYELINKYQIYTVTLSLL